MPRKLDPALLVTGRGKTVPDHTSTRPTLSGGGLVGAGPNIGKEESAPGDAGLGNPLGHKSLTSHVDDPKQAHSASAIEHDGHPDVLISGNVGGALDELIATVAAAPPYLGETGTGQSFSGITDWGPLKLRDASLDAYGGLTRMPSGVTPAEVYPYYFKAAGPALDTEFTHPGGDPRSDYLFNSGTAVVGSVPGAGYGEAHIGGFTRGGAVGPAPLPVQRTARIFKRDTGIDAETGRPGRTPITFSGSLYPADRGVLALLHLPALGAGTLQDQFLAQPLVTDEATIMAPTGRVVAATLLGGGIRGDKCIGGDCADPHVCDGDPGGIFSVGTDSDGKNDPFSFPGRATGQFDLIEIHNGIDTIDGLALIAPWNNYGNTAVSPGSARDAVTTEPAPGQVRLGTDPDADPDPAVTASLVRDRGIPILGGTTSAYTAVVPTGPGAFAIPIIGDCILLASNFFGYRLPVLKDYSPETGLKWTPRGEDATGSQETQRFFDPKAGLNSVVYPDQTTIGATLRSAGFYESSFDEDYWVWQVARYRHTFLMPSLAVDGDAEDVGTYWLVHFKREGDFEKCARDGIFPWDATDGYEVYGSSLVDSTSWEEDGNVANEWTANPAAPDGPAPQYGYAADPYHLLRSSVWLDPVGRDEPATTANAYTWTTLAVPATSAILWTSGVAYFTPRTTVAGTKSFVIDSLTVDFAAGFWTSYRTDDNRLTAGVAPAVIASMNPSFLVTAPFSYENNGANQSNITMTFGVPGTGFVPDNTYQHVHHIEIPFEYMGSNGSGVFSDANGPLDADTIAIALPGVTEFELLGDDDLPSFQADASLRLNLRRPLGHIDDVYPSLPFSPAAGHGVLLTEQTGGTILYHSTRFDETNLVGTFGNFLVNALGGPPNTSFSQLFVATKDSAERFLDETYRLRPALMPGLNGHGPYDATTLLNLVGPGMGGWAAGPVEVPVRIAYATAPWNSASWLLMEDHIVTLKGGGAFDLALQVGGVPHRNPPIAAAESMPFPSAGLLSYPQKNYTVSYSPVSPTHMTAAQPDYQTVPAGVIREYVRTLDAAFIDAAAPLAAAGATELVLRIDGVTLDDITFRAPGPGGLNSDRPAISMKVPGLTTWMDCGRADGGGPSKQDAVQDGAGCLILDNQTYTFKDDVSGSGYMGCYLHINVGPAAALFANTGVFSGYMAGDPIGEAPVMIKVQMENGAGSYNLELLWDGTGAGTVLPDFDPGAVGQQTGLASRDVRGIFGISIVHPDDTLNVPFEVFVAPPATVLP